MLNNQVTLTRHSIADLMYPVGSYYITESEELNTVEKMNAFFGGTWEQIKDCFLWATGDITSITYTENGTSVTKSLIAGNTGGEATHTLTIDEMPNHYHSYGEPRYTGGDWTCLGSPCDMNTTLDQNNSMVFHGYTFATGGSQAHNNMPPYRAVYMYHRTA